MNRRAFLAVSGRTVTLTLAAGAATTERLTALEYPQSSPDGLEQRVAAVIRAYDAQGNHRTGTEVDRASAEWLANNVRKLGVEPSLEAFTLSRVDPQSCYLRIGDRRIDGVPLFDAGFTAMEGVRGRLGSLGSDAEIGLAETTPSRPMVLRVRSARARGDRSSLSRGRFAVARSARNRDCCRIRARE